MERIMLLFEWFSISFGVEKDDLQLYLCHTCYYEFIANLFFILDEH